MSNANVLQTEEGIAALNDNNVPTDLGDKWSSEFPVLLRIASRECISDAFNYAATDAYFCLVYDQKTKENLYIFGHNGLPFESLSEILTKGCIPNRSGRQGGSFQGAGLAQAAMMLDEPNPLLGIVSKVGGNFVGGYGKPDFASNHWHVGEDDDFLIPILQRTWGPRHSSKFNVYYIFRVVIPILGDDSVELALQALVIADVCEDVPEIRAECPVSSSFRISAYDGRIAA